MERVRYGRRGRGYGGERRGRGGQGGTGRGGGCVGCVSARKPASGSPSARPRREGQARLSLSGPGPPLSQRSRAASVSGGGVPPLLRCVRSPHADPWSDGRGGSVQTGAPSTPASPFPSSPPYPSKMAFSHPLPPHTHAPPRAWFQWRSTAVVSTSRPTRLGSSTPLPACRWHVCTPPARTPAHHPPILTPPTSPHRPRQASACISARQNAT
jgi:hypothetical protein